MGISSDFDYEWDQPDVKHKYLIQRIIELTANLNTLQSDFKFKETEFNLLREDFRDLLEEHTHHLTVTNMMMLYLLGEFSIDRVKGVLKMMGADDKEHLLVADEGIQELIKQVRAKL